MKRRDVFHCAALLIVFLVYGCSSPMYLSTKEPKNNVGTYMMPYHSKIESVISVTIPAQTIGTTATDKDNKLAIGSPVITIGAVHQSFEKRYLYLTKNMWFSDSADFSTSTSGVPSKSDTLSTQQVTAMLTAVGQTAGGAAMLAKDLFGMPLVGEGGVQTMTPTLQKCRDAFDKVVNQKAFFYGEMRVNRNGRIDTTDINTLLQEGTSDTDYKLSIHAEDYEELDGGQLQRVPSDEPLPGFIVHEPSSVRISLDCVKNKIRIMSFASPQIVPIYRIRNVANPQRNFWTNPQNTYTITDGIITAHKFSDQSPAKTLIDLITSPIRAFLPIATTTTTTSVQTGGGKPDQTTSTSATQIAPPK